MAAMFRSLSADETSDMVVAKASLVHTLSVNPNMWEGMSPMACLNLGLTICSMTLLLTFNREIGWTPWGSCGLGIGTISAMFHNEGSLCVL